MRGWRCGKREPTGPLARAPVTTEDLEALETDVLAGFVLARAAAGLSDGTISSDVMHLEQVRSWFGRPLWEMEPADADTYFGKALRSTAKGTRLSRAQALKTFFLFLELRHKIEVHQMTGRVVECPIDEMNRPRGRQQSKLRIPPTAEQVGRLFTGWRQELATCRKFAPAARNYTACRLTAEIGLRVNETCKLDLPDIKWDLGRFGKLHVRLGKGTRGSGPRERMVPLINNAGATLRWFVEDVWGQFGDDHTRPGVALLPAERKNAERELVGNIRETALSQQGYRLNDIMKRVTSWAAIIAVPTAITGFYGQNVPYPGAEQPIGFWTSTVLIVVSAALITVFRKKNWL
jgi:site-specific recombinase XerD